MDSQDTGVGLFGGPGRYNTILVMKFVKVLIVLLTASCAPVTALPEATLRSQPVVTRTMIPFPTSPLMTPFPSPTPDGAFPAWVKDFANPILVSLDGQRPHFQDDFTKNLNQGWFYLVPASPRGPFYAHIEEGTLLIKLPEGQENRDSMVYNPKLVRRNFVLNFDFQFEETQPPDLARFQFDQSADQNVAFDLFKNKTWLLSWGPDEDRRSVTGAFDYFPPERITITIIMKEEACAVVLNDDPIAYASDCRPGPLMRSVPWAVTFHTISAPRYPAAVTIDNLKFWDLDKIPALP
jgi:hypothetical protein